MDHRNDQRTEQEMEEDYIDLGALLANFWRELKKLWWLVLLLTAAGASVFWVYIYVGTDPVYESHATFTVGTGDDESYSFYYSESTADQLSKTFPYILESNYFQSVLLQELGTDTLNGTVSSETVEGSNMVTMTVRSPDPEDALAILQTALQIYPEAARYVLGTIQFHMIDEPELPSVPVNQPQLWRTLAIGAAAGLALGIAILLLLGMMRRTVRTQEELREITNLRCLSVIPMVHRKARKKTMGNELSVLDRKTPFEFSESIRALQLRLERSMSREDLKVLLVTSVASGEGKSTVAVNLAEMFARKGKRTLLIDGDLRKNSASHMMKRMDSQKKSDMESSDPAGGKAEKDSGGESVIQNDKIQFCRLKRSGVWLLNAVKAEKNPAVLLSHDAFARFMETVRGKMDYIIIDSPPCGIFQDALILEEYADAILYVLKYDFLPKQKIQEGIASLGGSRKRFLGYVFNQCPQKPNEYGYSRYGSYNYSNDSHYGNDAETSAKREVEEEWDS